jgi:hypothetical protein
LGVALKVGVGPLAARVKIGSKVAVATSGVDGVGDPPERSSSSRSLLSSIISSPLGVDEPLALAFNEGAAWYKNIPPQ